MTEPVLLAEQHDAVLWLRLNRPAARNAISPELLTALDAAIRQAETDDETRVVVITGIGAAFCAGADLGAMRTLTSAADAAAANAAFIAAFNVMLCRLERLGKPTIAAVNGVAVAGGLELLLCCDLVLAADTARIGDGHARYALMPGGGGSVRLPRRVGVSLAKYLMLTGDLLPAAELTGLVLRTVPADQLLAAVSELAATLASRSPLGLARMKRLIDEGVELPAEQALLREHDVHAEHALSDDRREGLAAFAEKRTPRFTGR